MPVSLFDKNYAASYLNINSNAQPEEVLFYNKEVSLEAVVVFGAQKSLVDWLNQKYPSKKIKYLHHMSALLEGIVSADHSAEKKLFACLEKNTLSIAVKEGNKI